MKTTFKTTKEINGRKCDVLQSSYMADSGSFKVDTCYFSNGYGDGSFKFYFIEDKHLIDLVKDKSFTRTFTNFFTPKIYKYDCSSEHAFVVSGFVTIFKRSTSFYVVVDSFNDINYVGVELDYDFNEFD